MIQSRRSFIFGAASVLITAPAIVKAVSLMPVKQMLWEASGVFDGVALQSAMHPVVWHQYQAKLNEWSIVTEYYTKAQWQRLFQDVPIISKMTTKGLRISSIGRSGWAIQRMNASKLQSNSTA